MSGESRQELVNWVNSTLHLNISKVDECGKGFVYCQLLDSIYRDIPLKRVNFRARNEYEYLANFKVLQAAFTSHGIERPIEVDRLAKCRLQDNLEFLQWFKRFWDANYPTGTEYDASAVRSSFGITSLPGPPSSSPASSSSLGHRPSSTTSRSPSVVSGRLSAVGSANHVRPTAASRPSVTGKYRVTRPPASTSSASSPSTTSTTSTTRPGSSATALHSRSSITPHTSSPSSSSSSRLFTTSARTTQGRLSAAGTHTGPASTAAARQGTAAAGRGSSVGLRSASALGGHPSSASAAAAAAAVTAAREEAAAAQQAATEAQTQLAIVQQELEETRQAYEGLGNDYTQIMDHAELLTSEREFYFTKLREIEILMQSVSEMLKKKEEEQTEAKKSNGDSAGKSEGGADDENPDKATNAHDAEEGDEASRANGTVSMLEPKIFIKAIMDILYSTAEGFEPPSDTIMEVDNEDTFMHMDQEDGEEETF